MPERNTITDRALSGVIRFLLPILLILSSVWITLQSARIWVQIEYRMPGFPDDTYGFTLEDRLYWAGIDIDYLINDEGIDYFDAYRLPSGEPMHNERELRHMMDVKLLIGQTWIALGTGWILLLVVSFILSQRLGWGNVFNTIEVSAKGTIWLMLLLAVGLVIAFGVLFVGFHRIFFEGDTWLFSYSDTFIRLYPERFWRDTFALVAIITLVLSWAVRGISRWFNSRLGDRA